jgi:hypothetical protein
MIKVCWKGRPAYTALSRESAEAFIARHPPAIRIHLTVKGTHDTKKGDDR